MSLPEQPYTRSVDTNPNRLAAKAARLASNGDLGREFDSCFEMFNGKQVVLKILATPSLKECFPAKLIESWERMYPDTQIRMF